MFLLLGLSLTPISAAAQCPQSTLFCDLQPTYTSAPRYSVTCASGPSAGTGKASYDLPAGEFTGFGSATRRLLSGAGGIGCTDDFVVTGLPPGTPVTITASLHVKVTFSKNFSTGTGDFDVSLGEDSGVTRLTGHAAVDTIVTYVLHHPAGEHFPFSIGVYVVGTEATMSLTSQLSVDDLPPGAVLSSCNGFLRQGQSPVPAVPLSWGRLKAFHR